MAKKYEGLVALVDKTISLHFRAPVYMTERAYNKCISKPANKIAFVRLLNYMLNLRPEYVESGYMYAGNRVRAITTTSKTGESLIVVDLLDALDTID